MDLKKPGNIWNEFPEMSMEERPVLSSDLDKMVVKNPLSNAFYLKTRLLARIWLGSALWLFTSCQLRIQWKTDSPDLPQGIALLAVLSYFIYFQVRLLLFANYRTLLALKLVPFLDKLEIMMDKYILSFRALSLVGGFVCLEVIEKFVYGLSPTAYESFSRNNFEKWIIIIFLALSIYILFLHTIIPRYRKLQDAVRRYKYGIHARYSKK